MAVRIMWGALRELREPEGPCKAAGHPPRRPGWVCRCACGWKFHLNGRIL